MNKIEKLSVFSYFGSVISAVLASICCIGPLAFVFLGLSGAAFFANFEQYRWLFGAIALVFLALGFYITYRDKGSCVPDTSCAVNPGRRKLNKILLWVSAILVIGFILSPNTIGFFIT